MDNGMIKRMLKDFTLHASRFTLHAACLLGLLLLVSCSVLTGPSADSSPTVETMGKGEENRIRLGDDVSIRITGTSTTLDNIYAQTIGEAGNITLPYIDEIKAQGKTPQELAEGIKKAYLTVEIKAGISSPHFNANLNGFGSLDRYADVPMIDL